MLSPRFRPARLSDQHQFPITTRRARGDGWSWNWDAPKPERNPAGSRGPGLSVTGGRDAASDVDGRQVGGSQRGQLRLGPAGGRTSITNRGPGAAPGRVGDGHGYSRAGAAAAAAAANDLRGYVPAYGLGADLGGMNLDDDDTAGAAAYVDDDDLDSPEQHQTHDVIITEIEEINLTDYMQTLQAPTFSEEALATADFGFGGDRTFSGGLYGAGMKGYDAAASPKQGNVGAMGGGDKFPMRSETPGRAGRRVWSRGGNRSTDASGTSATGMPGIDRPPTGGLDEADVNRPLSHGLDDDEDGGDPEVVADIFDDSDDDSWGEETHAVDTFGGNQNAADVLSDDEDGGHAASPKAMGAVNPSFGGSAIAARSPVAGGAGGSFSGFVSGGGASLPGRQSPLPGSSSSSFAASREARRRREAEGGLRRHVHAVRFATRAVREAQARNRRGRRRGREARRRRGRGMAAGSRFQGRLGRREVGGCRGRVRGEGERLDPAEGGERGRVGAAAAAAEQAAAAAGGDQSLREEGGGGGCGGGCGGAGCARAEQGFEAGGDGVEHDVLAPTGADGGLVRPALCDFLSRKTSSLVVTNLKPKGAAA